MNKILKRSFAFMLGLMLAIVCLLTVKINTNAENTVTVTGTVKNGSTSSVLKVDCDGSEMIIKIDSNTDLSECKVIIPGSELQLAVYVGSDRYLHAAKIVLKSTSTTTSTTSQSVMISGNIKEGSTNSLIKLNTIIGDFDIKFDAATDLSGCTLLMAGRNIVVTCVKDSAGALYASKIADGTNTSTTSNSTNTTGSSTELSGRIASNSTASVIYLKTDSATFTIKVDSATETSKGVVLLEGSTVTLKVYNGTDSSLHAESIVQSRTSNTYTADSSKLYKITGKISSGSTESVVKFDMGDGSIMNLKLDDSTVCDNGLILTNGTKVTITCGRAADAYMHAVKIEKAQ